MLDLTGDEGVHIFELLTFLFLKIKTWVAADSLNISITYFLTLCGDCEKNLYTQKSGKPIQEMLID